MSSQINCEVWAVGEVVCVCVVVVNIACAVVVARVVCVCVWVCGEGCWVKNGGRDGAQVCDVCVL